MNKNLKDLLINKDSSIFETLECIDKSAKAIAFVIDKENGCFLGTITDGDIRRALLKNKDLKEKISNLYNENYIYVEEGTSLNKVKKLFVEQKIKVIPVLDKDKVLVGYYEIDDVVSYSKDRSSNPVLIMAGGLGSRLKPLTDDMPKPMLTVGNKPILQTIIEQFRNSGFDNIYISVNYKSDIIKNYFRDGSDFDVNITYIEETKRMGTAGAIKLAQKYLDEPFFVMNGDILTTINYKEFLEFHIENNFSMSIGSREYEMQVPYGVLERDELSVTSLKEKPVYSYTVSGGMYVLNPDIVDMIPEDEFYDITQLINSVVDNNLKVGSFPIREYWMDIGRIEDYNQANQDINKYF